MLSASYRRPVARVIDLERDLTRSVAHSEPGTSEQLADGVVGESVSGDLMGSAEAANRLGCSAENVRALCRRGALPATRHAGRWLIPAEAVTERTTRKDPQCRTSASTSTGPDATSPPAPRPPSQRAAS
ncbi:helix-turn-helix domain-containing protein [Gordonia sp. WA4-43]|uniref:helix-turn-helix domain-containing protein n=1 Tax=Gordonia sp. WA4-43 TaxID=2878678 RepID=UPI001CFBA809|nr:helix-turn-helix domain-containing protein [Gordonia sp. WA4-43]